MRVPAFPTASTGTLRERLAKVNPQAFPKKARLLKHADFERVYKTGERLFCKDLTFFFGRGVGGPGLAEPGKVSTPGVRVGLTVGRALGGAVVRNRIKRRVREAVRKHLKEISSPVDVVVNPKKSAADVDLAELEKQVHQSFVAIERGERGSAGVSRQPRERKKSERTEGKSR